MSRLTAAAILLAALIATALSTASNRSAAMSGYK